MTDYPSIVIDTVEAMIDGNPLLEQDDVQVEFAHEQTDGHDWTKPRQMVVQFTSGKTVTRVRVLAQVVGFEVLP